MLKDTCAEEQGKNNHGPGGRESGSDSIPRGNGTGSDNVSNRRRGKPGKSPMLNGVGGGFQQVRPRSCIPV